MPPTISATDLTASHIVFVSDSTVIYNLENAFTHFILTESCKHIRGEARQRYYFHGTDGETGIEIIEWSKVT